MEFREGDLLAGVADGSRSTWWSATRPTCARATYPALAPDVRLFEPAAALDGGPDGLDVYRRLVPEAARALRPGGALLLEVGDDQAAGCARAWRSSAGFALVTVHKDLSRKDRIVEAILPGAPSRCTRGRPRTARPAQALRRALDAGAIIGVPTDTVYGIAARWDSTAGVAPALRGQAALPGAAGAVLFPSVEAIKAALPDLDPARRPRCWKRCCPGPYTFVVATAGRRAPSMVGTPDSLGVRVPDQPDLLAAAGRRRRAAGRDQRQPHRPADARHRWPRSTLSCWPIARWPMVPRGRGSPAAAGVASTVVDLRPLAGGRRSPWSSVKARWPQRK